MLEWTWLGRADYERVHVMQLEERERVLAGAPGTVFLCEHPPVITLGRSAKRENVLAAGDVPTVHIERGGDVTYHGPGQLMIYPVVRIPKGVVDFLERVAAAICRACGEVGVEGAAFEREPAGIYVAGAKIAACGIHVAHQVSVHGFALDVDTPGDMWSRIRPCGLSLAQTSVTRERARRELPPIAVDVVARTTGPRVVDALL
jgi:lipoyl(octanoyl) transferase